MLSRLAWSCLFMLACDMMTQFSVQAQSGPLAPPGTQTKNLGPHDKATDSDGRTVENTGANGNITVSYTGSIDAGTPNGNGGKDYVITGSTSKAKIDRKSVV